MHRLELFPFRFRDPLTGKWVRARYKASLADLEQRYGGGRYEITGPPEIREVDPGARYFNPLRGEDQAGRAASSNLGPFFANAPPVERQVFPVVGVAS